MTIYPRTPGDEHWKALAAIESCQLEPEQFLQYWDVTYADLARICHCAVPTVKRWFASADHHAPTVFHKLCLALAHRTWSKLR